MGESGTLTMTGLEADDQSRADGGSSEGDASEELEAAAAEVVRAYFSYLGSHFEYGDLADCGLWGLPVDVVGESEVILTP